jgi:hypothetical protein
MKDRDPLPRRPLPDRLPPRSSSEAGFSLIEGLIATALLLLVLVGILPLFSNAMLNNLRGNDASQVANGTVDGFERLSSLPFDNFFINPVGAAGAAQVVRDDVWALEGDLWVPTIAQSPVTNDKEQFTRSARIRQFHIDDLRDNGTLDNPLGEGDLNAHIKVIEMDVSGERALGGPAFRTVLVKAK